MFNPSTVICTECGENFNPRCVSQKYCSKKCNREALYRRERDKYHLGLRSYKRRKRALDRCCIVCGQPLSAMQAKYCKPCGAYNRVEMNRLCSKRRQRTLEENIRRKTVYNVRRAKIIAIAKAALELHPELMEIFNDSR